MSKLCITLPPFAPDYSGAASALFELGGMTVIHDASGCTGNYTGFDEPRWFGSSSAVYCSGLRHMDAVLGNDEKFINETVEAAKSIKPEFIALLGSPVPTVIGTDLKGMASEIEALSGIPSIGLETKGLAYYGSGICDATVSIMKKFGLKKSHVKNKDSVNILGMTPLDFYIGGWERKFTELFEGASFHVNACFNMGMTIEDMKNSVNAELNIAVSQAGVQIGKYMFKKYGIPYIAVTPLGDGSIALEKAENAIKGKIEAYDYGQPSDILIVGEQIISDSIREYIYRKNGVYADVAVLFDCCDEYLKNNDIKIKNELQLRNILNSGKYRTILADPMVRGLLRKENNDEVKFIDFPHVAVSSKVHWDEYKPFLGDDSVKWLDTVR